MLITLKPMAPERRWETPIEVQALAAVLGEGRESR